MTEPVFGSETAPENSTYLTAPSPAPTAEPSPVLEDAVTAEAAAAPPALQESTAEKVATDAVDVAEVAAEVAAPFIPSAGVADWLREAITALHNRISKLGG